MMEKLAVKQPRLVHRYTPLIFFGATRGARWLDGLKIQSIPDLIHSKKDEFNGSTDTCTCTDQIINNKELDGPTVSALGG
jgi:hypothetical protein